ncbi:MAG: acetamidase/formamidase family protein [Actinomycetota bacterium]
MASYEIVVDHGRPVQDEPDRCHNRWHPEIPPVLSCRPGDEILLGTRDAVDGQFTLDSSHDDVLRIDRWIVHPLTGPVRVEGADPGDVLVVEILEIVPASFGYTAQIPGFGFLADEFPAPFLVRWEIADGFATSPDLPGVRIPGEPFMGTMGVAPSRDLLELITRRERALKEQGEDVVLPDPRGAVPATEPVASEGLRTKPPRENGGNLDVRQMVAGTRILFPVWTEGGLFSAGDGHFAQGDGESCGTAIEMRATLRVRLDLRKGEAAKRGVRDVRFESPAADLDARPGRTFSTTGLCVYAEGGGRANDLTVAAKNALRNMIEHLVHEFGCSRQQAYAICSVAVDLKVGEIVDSPNYVVTATVPIEIFQ